MSRYSPQLVTMQGDNAYYGIDLYMGMEPMDRRILDKGYVTPAEEKYLYSTYPELMGFLPAILAAIPAAAAGIGGIISAVKGKKPSPQNTQQANDATVAALQAEIQELARQREQETLLAQQKAQQRQILIMIGVPAAAAILFLLNKNKKRSR